MMSTTSKQVSIKTKRDGFASQQVSLKSRAIAECGLPAHRLKQAAAAIAGGFDSYIDEDDLISEAWLMQHQYPGLGATKITAYVVQVQRQKRRKSIGATISIDSQVGEEGETHTIDLVAYEPEEIEKWRQDDPNIDQYLADLNHKTTGCCDRRKRQRMTALAKKSESEFGQPTLFG